MDGNSRHSFQPPILNVLTLFDNADFGTLNTLFIATLLRAFHVGL
jgi:hypothetical protein